MQAAESLFASAYSHIESAVAHMSEEEQAKEIKAMKPTVGGDFNTLLGGTLCWA